MRECDVAAKIVTTFSTAYKFTCVKVSMKTFGFDCLFKLNGDDERGLYYNGWFKWQSNGNIKLRLNESL